MRVHWGAAIAAVYVTFAVCTTGFVVFALQHPVQLVSDDYYADSLHHDARRTAIENARRLDVRVLGAGPAGVMVTMPQALRADARGTLRLYRPSDSSADRTWTLALDGDGTQRIATADLATGRWIAQLAWTSGGDQYYEELPVVIR